MSHGSLICCKCKCTNPKLQQKIVGQLDYNMGGAVCQGCWNDIKRNAAAPREFWQEAPHLFKLHCSDCFGRSKQPVSWSVEGNDPLCDACLKSRQQEAELIASMMRAGPSRHDM